MTEKAHRDSSVVESALKLVSFRHAQYVLLYAATDGEINIDALADEALRRHKKVAFPRCDPSSRTMRYHFVESLDELLTGAYGIREPMEDAPAFSPEIHCNSAVCFVPGLVFDRSGYRIGYGKGYFDRYLSSFTGSTVGVIYEDFIVDSIPKGRFDKRVDILLTEKSMRITSEN